MLTGSVYTPIEAQQAGDVAARLVGGADKVVNSIVVRGRDQVMLKVTVAEVRRNIIKQMGIDLSASMNYGTAVVKFNNTNPFTANGTARRRQLAWARSAQCRRSRRRCARWKAPAWCAPSPNPI